MDHPIVCGQENYCTVDTAINSLTNTIRKIVDQPGQNTAGPYYDVKARELLERISEFNRLHPNRPQVVRYAIYRLFVFVYSEYRIHREK